MDDLNQQEFEFVFAAVANTSIQAKDSAFAQTVLEKLQASYKDKFGEEAGKVDEKENKKSGAAA
jgi:hypothetical protein